MSLFEIGMLICFGCSWPFAVVKTYKTKNVKGKSLFFLYMVLLGYVFGILNKIYNNPDNVIWLYALNSVFVVADIVLFYKYKNRISEI